MRFNHAHIHTGYYGYKALNEVHSRACTHPAHVPLVQGFEQGLVTGKVRELTLRNWDVFAPDVRLKVALADLSEQAAQAIV